MYAARSACVDIICQCVMRDLKRGGLSVKVAFIRREISSLTCFDV